MRWLSHCLPNGEVLHWTPVLSNLPQGIALGLSQQPKWLLCCNKELRPLTLASAGDLLPLLSERRNAFERRLKRALAFKGFEPSLATPLITLLIECSLSPVHAPEWAAQGVAWLRGEEQQIGVQSSLNRIIFDQAQFSSSLRQQAYGLLKKGIKKAVTDPPLQHSRIRKDDKVKLRK